MHIEDYKRKIQLANSLCGLYNLSRIAAYDDTLTYQEYSEIYVLTERKAAQMQIV